MKFLIYTENTYDENILIDIIKSMSIKISIDTVDSFHSFLEKFNTAEYNTAFLDYNKINLEIVQYIHNNKQQNIILINETFTCFNDFDCIKCKDTFNLNILIKPFCKNKVTEIILNKFKCDVFNKDEQMFLIKKIINEISLNHINVLFNYEQREFILDEIHEHLKIKALIDIVELLKKNDLKYQILNEDTIKLNNTIY